MSSTERAPEPTMEEILASIRRIISDDEASSTQQRATSSEYAEQVRVEDAEYEAADTQMIADIERALGNVSVAAEPAPVDDDPDDILELTEPGGASILSKCSGESFRPMNSKQAQVVTAPIISISPWAILITPISPNVIASPSASRM